jgi:hypothetical protein
MPSLRITNNAMAEHEGLHYEPPLDFIESGLSDPIQGSYSGQTAFYLAALRDRGVAR